MKTVIKLSFYFTLMMNSAVYAEIITDGSLGANTTLSGSMQIPQSLGTTVGNNLFHSFNRFNINTGESATFTGNNSLANVISRVTGGQVSTINGLLQSTIGNANFYFINPAGVVFGANAQIDVPSAFYVSTADTLRFIDGSQFNASNPAASQLSIAEPTGFGFLNNQGGNITVQDSILDFKTGSTASLSAHNVTISNGQLTNPSGTLNVYATGDTVSELPINSPVTQPLTGRIELNTGNLNTNGDPGGTINIQGGDIVMSNESSVTADSEGSGNAGGISIKGNSLSLINASRINSHAGDTGNGGNITIDTNAVLIDGQSNGFAGISSSTFDDVIVNAGNAGNISVKTNNLTLSNGGYISSDAWGSGNAGKIVIDANNVLIDGQSSAFTGILSNTFNEAMTNAGKASNVSVNTNNLTVTNGGQISSDTWGIGNAGNVAIKAANTLLDGQGNDTRISSSSWNGVIDNAGNAGNVSITGNNVIVLNRGQISSATNGTGNADSINIKADNVLVDGQGNKNFTGIHSDTLNETLTDSGNAGSVTIKANNINVVNNGQIASDTWGSGQAGNISINADNITVDGQGKNAFITSSSRNKILANAGNAGLLDIKGNNLSVSNKGRIETLTSGTGNAGDINITQNNTISVQNSASIKSSTSGAGSGGQITLSAPVINVDNASISAEASAKSQGQTGDINITAGQTINLSNQGKISLKNDANIANPAVIKSSSITLSAPDINLNNSEITTAATGNVDASDININFSNTLNLDPSFITTTANTGNGGNINIVGGQLINLQDSGFLTSVSGANSNGGNINVTTDYLIMQTGVIQANAVGGSGGNISLNLKALIPSFNSLFLAGSKIAWFPFIPGLNVIQAASENGVSGTINVTSPQFDISASVSGLDSEPLIIPNIDKNQCQSSAMLGSTLTRGGQGGIPADESQYSFIPPATIPPKSQHNTAANPLIHTSSLSDKSFPCTSLQP